MVASLMVFFFSLTMMTLSSPTGIGLGLVLVSLSPDENPTQVVLSVVQGLAGGSLLYTAVAHLLPAWQGGRAGQVGETAAGMGAALLGFVLFMGIQMAGGGTF